jgi:23S rRNA pseudouridine1911/1915/1917 synthase
MLEKKPTLERDIKVSAGEEARLDRFLALRFPQQSRTTFQRLINNRNILVDGHPASPKHKLKSGQKIHIDWPSSKLPSTGIINVPIPFPILYEDAHMMVINKPPNLLCHPVGWRRDGQTLVELLAPKLEKGMWPDEVRPGLVHRLDRDTSGVLLYAKTPEAHAHLSRQFAQRRTQKTYMALVQGSMEDKAGTLECRISRSPQQRQRFSVTGDGRLAITSFKVIEHMGKLATLVELHPLTGRTHQLRVQLSSYKYPILGDRVYGVKNQDFPFIKRQLLHALRIKFFHPETKKEMDFKAPLPDDFQHAIKLIRSMA